MPRRRVPDDEPELRKGERTRARLADVALRLFRERGLDETTMRDIAAEAGLSLGAAYHYFPSKEAFVLDYYRRTGEALRAEVGARLAGAHDLRARLAAVLDARLDLVRRDRRLLAALLRVVLVPDEPLSVLGEATRAVRESAITLAEDALDGHVPDEARRPLAMALWLLQLGLLLYAIRDRSPGLKRTRQLVDGTVEVLVPLVQAGATPMLAPIRSKLRTLLVDAGLLANGR